MSRLTKGGRRGRGANWANRANRANSPPNDQALARQVTLEMIEGVGLGG